ncbi:MAG: phosphodiester glycosidase family protein [Pseudomonadota bacterium]|nr:phosphodiester glycosidase family protein [Pseudomonadota bacterium]
MQALRRGRLYAAMVMLAALCLGVQVQASVDSVTVEQLDFKNVPITVVTVDLHQADLRLFWRDPQGQGYRRVDRLREEMAQQGLYLRFAMNAGMYHADRTPVGLLVMDGRVLSPLNADEGFGNFFLLPNGVWAIDQRGRSHILPTAQVSPAKIAEWRWATQSGPMLLINGEIHAAFQPHSTSRKIRNAVGQLDDQRLVLVISEAPINFYDFALFFREILGVKNALYLDGSISSLYDAHSRRMDWRDDLGVMLGVVELAEPSQLVTE